MFTDQFWSFEALKVWKYGLFGSFDVAMVTNFDVEALLV